MRSLTCSSNWSQQRQDDRHGDARPVPDLAHHPQHHHRGRRVDRRDGRAALCRCSVTARCWSVTKTRRDEQTYPAKHDHPAARRARGQFLHDPQRGEVEVVLQDRKQPMRPSCPASGLGEFFGEIELLRGGKSIASVRASAEGPVEVLTVHREEFQARDGPISDR
ncbi:MAG: hypothetical protein MZV70_17890 [Desulfobacterales bacterium]|nr:hypothetical protein [Desulfobacterales bacterium]